MTPYMHLVKESLAHSMPDAYKADLSTHDKARLHGDNAPEAFGWVLRNAGTLLLDATMRDSSRRSYIQHIAEYGRCEGDRCYFWNGSTLAAVTPQRMGELMAPYADNGNGGY